MTASFEELSTRARRLADKRIHRLAADEALVALSLEGGDPTQRDALTRLVGICLVTIGERNRALHYFDALLEQDPNDAIALAYKGRIFYEHHRLHEALPLIERALQIDPENTYAWEALIVIRSGLNEPDAVAEAIAGHEKISPAPKEVYRHEGLAALRRGDRERGERYLRSGAAGGDGVSAAELLQHGFEIRSSVEHAGVGVMQRNQNYALAAIDSLKKGIELGFGEDDTRNIRIHRFLFPILNQMGRNEEAKTLADALVLRYPKRADAWLAKSLADGTPQAIERAFELDPHEAGLAWAESLYMQERTAESIAVLDARIANDSEDPAAHIMRGEILVLTGNLPEGKASLLAAERLGHKNAANTRVPKCGAETAMDQFNLGEQFERRNRFADAAKHFEAAAEAFAKDIRAPGDHASRFRAKSLYRCVLANEDARVNDPEAQAKLEAAFELDTTNPGPLLSLGRLLIKKGEEEQGLLTLEKAGDLDLSQGLAWFYRAEYFYEHKRYEEVVKEANMAADRFVPARKNGLAADALMLSGMSNEALGRLEDARNDYQDAMDFGHRLGAARLDAVSERIAAKDPNSAAAKQLLAQVQSSIGINRYPVTGAGLAQAVAQKSERATALLGELKAGEKLSQDDVVWLIQFFGR